jgi:hypothetical protein
MSCEGTPRSVPQRFRAFQHQQVGQLPIRTVQVLPDDGSAKILHGKIGRLHVHGKKKPAQPGFKIRRPIGIGTPRKALAPGGVTAFWKGGRLSGTFWQGKGPRRWIITGPFRFHRYLCPLSGFGRSKKKHHQQ